MINMIQWLGVYQMTREILSYNAFSGCDKTYSIFGQGKTKLWEKSDLKT